MTKLQLVTCIVLATFLPVALTGCAAMHVSVDFEAHLNTPFGKLDVKVVVDSQGQKVFRVSNPTDTDACIQPRDGDGNKIGGPLELPAGGSVDLPPGADSDKSEVIKKPKKAKPAEPKQTAGVSNGRAAPQLNAIAIQPVVIWPGLITSFTATGYSKVSEYSIAARDAQGAFAALDKLGQGLTVPNAELVVRGEQ